MTDIEAPGGLTRWQARALAALAGGGAALALPPFEAWYAIFPSFALVVALVASAPDPRNAAWRAWAAGAGWFGVAMHWIVQPFFVEPEIYGWMAPFAVILMAGGLALFWALAGWLAARLAGAGWARAVAFAGLLALTEALRGRVFTGLPWAQPGHGLIATEALALSAYVGPLGLGVVLLAIAAGSAALFLTRGPAMAALPLALGLGLGLAPLTPSALLPAEDAPVLRVVQINAPQHLKWDPDMIPVFFARAIDLTATAPGGLGPADLVIWPETSLPALLRHSGDARAAISEAAGDAQVLIGGQRYAGIEPRNILAHLDGEGAIVQVYDKHHLVPFGEYMPLRGLADRLGLQGLAQQLSGGYRPGNGPGIMDLGPAGRAFPMICYELIFPHYIHYVERPDFMVNVTNDAWFGSFSMPHQHLAIARLRAAEQGLPVIRAANTGISAVIDGRGQVLRALPMDAPGVIDTILPPSRPATLYSRTGDWPAFLMALFATALGVWASRCKAAIES